jgi:hypothetical protein
LGGGKSGGLQQLRLTHNDECVDQNAGLGIVDMVQMSEGMTSLGRALNLLAGTAERSLSTHARALSTDLISKILGLIAIE